MAAITMEAERLLRGKEVSCPDLFAMKYGATRVIAVDTLANGKKGYPCPVGYLDGGNPVIFRSLLQKLELGLRITRRDREAAARAVILRSRLD
ncbi:MAG: hypothetical protein ACP6IQ_01800 [Candidatus Njordarchaeia archaeon]